MTNVNCLVIRRSTNTNYFGLGGIWVICENSRRVFSFAANDLDARAYQVGEFVPVPFIGGFAPLKGQPLGTLDSRPNHELARLEGEVTDVPKFLALFNDTLADKWNTYRQAKAIVAA